MRALGPLVTAVVALVVAPGAGAADPASEIPQHSVWIGSYTCAQGMTSIRLTLETRSSGGDAMGLFEFGPHDKNPDLPRGSFWMKGQITRTARGELAVKLAPDKWKVQPPGWIMVPIAATGDREDRVLAGRIEHPSCGAITVRRMQR